MDRPLEEIEFLALSSNRVAVLSVLRAGPQTRRELEAETGASQPTLGRILRDFSERNWVQSGQDGYELTATGRLVASGMTDLYAIFETELKLRDVIGWLPTDHLEFDLLALRDATITVPTETRPSAPVSRLTTLLQEAQTVRAVSYAFNEQSLEIARRQAKETGQTFSGVFSASAIEAVADDPTLRDRLTELLESAHTELRIVETEIPLAVTIADDVVSMLVREESGLLQAAIDTDDERVRTWAHTFYDTYWERARPLESDDLPSGE